MLQVAVVAVLVVPVSCVSQGGFEHSLWTMPVTVLVCSPPMLEVAVDGVLVVPVSCVSHGGFEHTLCTVPVRLVFMLDEDWVAVLVVPVTWVSQGGLEHICWACPILADAVVAVLVVPVS